MHTTQKRVPKKKLTRLVDHRAAVEAMGEQSAPTMAEVTRWEISQRQRALKDGRCPPLFVVLVRIDRQYGGPEEGGWWYDWREIQEVRRVWGFRTLLAAVRTLRSEYDCSNRPGRHSVIGGADYELVVTPREAEIEKLQSTRRPTYE